MTRKERTSAFKGFTDQEKDAVMNLMTDEQKERLVQDIRSQAVLDFRRGKERAGTESVLVKYFQSLLIIFLT